VFRTSPGPSGASLPKGEGMAGALFRILKI
jgi:hypothetical protein